MRRFVLSVCLSVVACGLMSAACAQQLHAAESLADPFEVPETDDVGELLEFTQQTLKFEPSSQDELEAYESKAPPALREACARIRELEKDKSSMAWRTATAILLQLDIRDLGKAGATVNKRKLLADAEAYVKGSSLGAMEYQVAQGLGTALEYSGEKELAAEAYTTLGKLLKESENPRVAERAEQLIGAGRRMGLVGKPLELKGTTLAGKPFDIKDLRGKVVLIDFWATWCGPCRAEHPNIEKNYETYRDAGFEVVGISLDDDREALEEYVKDHETAWITLHEKDARGQHPAATYYGIMGIPAMMLVDQEGKVVSLNARGPKLGEELEKLLGKQ